MRSKFLQISLGISMMLFAAAFFVRSFNTANASPAVNFNSKKAVVSGDSFTSVGISNDYAYYFSFDPNGFGTLRKAPLSSAE